MLYPLSYRGKNIQATLICVPRIQNYALNFLNRSQASIDTGARQCPQDRIGRALKAFRQVRRRQRLVAIDEENPKDGLHHGSTIIDEIRLEGAMGHQGILNPVHRFDFRGAWINPINERALLGGSE